eukprot:355506-Chlamydomonas_euryale.AAC.2
MSRSSQALWQVREANHRMRRASQDGILLWKSGLGRIRTGVVRKRVPFSATNIIYSAELLQSQQGKMSQTRRRRALHLTCAPQGR